MFGLAEHSQSGIPKSHVEFNFTYYPSIYYLSFNRKNMREPFILKVLTLFEEVLCVIKSRITNEILLIVSPRQQ